jgi:hypothetical protein
LVATLRAPGGNPTGATTLNEELVAKRIELAHEAIPKSIWVALVVNPTSPKLTEVAIEDAQQATHNLGLRLDV